MPNSRPTFFVKRSARLAARLQLMTWCWRFARQAGGRVVVLWPPVQASVAALDGAEYFPSLIFDLAKWYGEGGADELVFLEGRVKEPDGAASVTAAGTYDRDILAREPGTFVEHLPLTARLAHEPADEAHLRTSLRETWARLPYHPAIARSLASIAGTTGTDYLALHVRSGDVIDVLRRELAAPDIEPNRFKSILKAYLMRVAPLDSFHEPVEEAIQAGRRIVYLSDRPETAAHFTARFGARHFILADRFARDRQPIQKAFIDFNLLVRAAAIVGTSSIYSHFAATLGADRLLDVTARAPLDVVRRQLHEVHLAGIALDPALRRRIDAELEAQHAGIVAGIGLDFAPAPLPVK